MQGPSSFVTVENLVILPGPDQGLFIYSTNPPSLNSLIQSETLTAFTDSVGNAILPGSVNYHQITAGQWIAIQDFNGQITFNIATSEAGPWTAQSTIASDFTNDLTLTAQATLGLTSALGASISISSPSNGISTVGDFVVGNGNAGYATDPSLGGRELWHALNPTGFTAVNQAPKYRLKFDGNVEFTGEMSVNAGGYAGGTTIATLGSHYIPNQNAALAVIRDVSNAYTAVVVNIIAGTGVVSIPINLTAGDIIIFGGGSYRLVT